MADNVFTQFDTVLSDDICNLVMGAPSESILKMASVKFQEATTARMVATVFIHSLVLLHAIPCLHVSYMSLYHTCMHCVRVSV